MTGLNTTGRVVVVITTALILMLGIAGCGDDNGTDGLAGNSENEETKNQNSENLDSGENHQNPGTNNSTPQEPPTFGFDELVYQSGSNQLTALQIIGPHSNEPSVSRRVLYEHPTEIHSFRMLRDRTGIIITARVPDPDYATHHTHAAYFVDAAGAGTHELIPPLEVDTETATLRVEDSTGGLGGRIWFSIHQSGMNASGNMVSSQMPMAVDQLESLEVYPLGCSSNSPIRSHFDGQQVALVERLCGHSYDEAYVTTFQTPELEGRNVVAEEGDLGLSYNFARDMEWLTENMLLVVVPGGNVALFDVTGAEEPMLWFEDAFSYVALAPDRSVFVGRQGSELYMVSLAVLLDTGEASWWVLADDVEDAPPSF